MTAIPPMPISVDPDGIPAALKERRAWVVWRYDLRTDEDGDVEWAKVPYYPEGRRADPTSPSTWSSWSWCWESYLAGGWDGVGHVVTGSGLVAGDLDKVVVDAATDGLVPLARRIVDRLDTYTEYSPSGTGVRLLLIGTKPGERCRRKWVELYSERRYVTLTGRRLDGTPATPQPRQAQLEGIYRALFPPAEKAGRKVQSAAPLEDSPRAALPDEEIVRRAYEAANGPKFGKLWEGCLDDYDGDHSAADQALCCLLAFWTEDEEQIDALFRQSGLYRPKWERADYRERTITHALNTVGERYDSLPDWESINESIETIYAKYNDSQEDGPGDREGLRDRPPHHIP